jgi:hypothetical protein
MKSIYIPKVKHKKKYGTDYGGFLIITLRE